MPHKDKRMEILLVMFAVIFNSAIGNQDSPSVIIVGAGPSGIAAASKLFENGFKNITILEAENRIGGRVFTTKLGDYLVDMGGQWVDGEVDNVSFELAWPLGLLEKIDRGPDWKQVLFDSAGNPIDPSMTEDIMSFYKNRSDSILEDSAKNNESVGGYLENEIKKYLETHPNWDKASKGVLHMLNMLQMADDAADSWWNISKRNYIEFHQCEGDRIVNWKERGYSTILDILMKRYPNPEEELPVANNTLLNTKVSLIDHKDTVTVTTTKGEKFYADHVIFTPSLGVLKENYNTLFQPSLSEEKIKTIKALGFGSAAKIYLLFEEPWWGNESKSDGFNLLWRDEDVAQLENDPEKRWLLGLVGFFFVEHKPLLLCGWVSGKYSREMENLPERQVFDQSIEVLRRFFGKSYNVTSPYVMMGTMWSRNENFKGVYSYRSVEAEAENVWHATLGEPIGEKKPVVLFAGEATNPHRFGTVHGAIETGRREAERLMQLYPKLAKTNASPDP